MEAHIFNIQKFSLHDGAGIRTDVFFQGCSLRCAWCSNPESQPLCAPAAFPAKSYSVAALLRELLKDKAFYDKSGGGVTLTGGEPLLQPDFVVALCDALRHEGVHVALETAANVSEGDFKRCFERCDMAHIDCKHYDSAAHKKATGTGNELILKNLAYALHTPTPVVVRVPVIPDFNAALEDAARFCALFHSLAVQTVQLLPFHQLGESKYQKLGLPYAYTGAAQTRDEALIPFAAVFKAEGFSVQIGG